MQRPFWENNYRNDDVSAFSIDPNPTVKEMVHLFEKNWRILDVGCGEGKNVIYSAKQGFRNIDAFDTSEAGVTKLRRLAAKNNVSVNGCVQDLRTFEFVKPYDLVMTHGTLHFVTRDEWRTFLNKAKQYTRSNGIHIIQVFTNKLPPTLDIEPFIRGLADEGEIEKLYEDWEILQSKKYTFEEQHPGVPIHEHASNKIVARKP